MSSFEKNPAKNGTMSFIILFKILVIYGTSKRPRYENRGLFHLKLNHMKGCNDSDCPSYIQWFLYSETTVSSLWSGTQRRTIMPMMKRVTRLNTPALVFPVSCAVKLTNKGPKIEANFPKML
jgi:hypothetical protein